MNPFNLGLVDVLRTCAELLPLAERLTVAAASRRWHDAAEDSTLWVDIDVPHPLTSMLPALLSRHGSSVRRLVLAAGSPMFQSLPKNLICCTQLCHLVLHCLRGPDLHKNHNGIILNSLRRLQLTYMPYFVLGQYSHYTGVHSATVPLQWVLGAFPNVEDLACDYLEIGGALASPCKLKTLSLVACVINEDRPAMWGCQNCNRDVPLIAKVTPQLEHLVFRDPRVHFGRMRHMPGQSTDELLWMCRWFCAMDVAQLRHICKFLPALRCLTIATMRDDTSDALQGMCLDKFLGVGQHPLKLRFGGMPCPDTWRQQGSGSNGPKVIVETFETHKRLSQPAPKHPTFLFRRLLESETSEEEETEECVGSEDEPGIEHRDPPAASDSAAHLSTRS